MKFNFAESERFAMTLVVLVFATNLITTLVTYLLVRQ